MLIIYPIKGLSSPNKMTIEKVTNQDANAVKLELLANLKGEKLIIIIMLLLKKLLIKIKIILHNKKMFSIIVLKILEKDINIKNKELIIFK